MVKYLEIGQIVNTFGIKGMVKVKPFTDDISRFDKLKTIYIQKKQEKKEYSIEEVKYHKQMVLLKLKDINDIDKAETLRGSYILVDRDKEEPLEEGIYYIVDLLGLEVFSDEGNLLGKVDDIFNTGSNDIYVIKDELPGTKEVIKDVNLKEGKIIVHLIPGLL